IYSNLPPLPDGFGSAILDALWHFDPNYGGPWLIRHVATGLTCRLAPQKHDRLALRAVSIESPLAEGAMTLTRLHQLNAICAILGASDRDKSLDLRGLGLRKRL